LQDASTGGAMKPLPFMRNSPICNSTVTPRG
jgi:hypothetical protein